MATFWERINDARRAATAAFAGQSFNPAGDVVSPGDYGVYHGLTNRERERVALYEQYWNYYNGRHRAHLRRRQSPQGPGPDDNTIVNVSRRIVNKGIGFLFGVPLEWEIPDAESSMTGENDASEFLSAVWRSDEWRMVFLQELAQNGFVTGDWFVQIVPGDPMTPGGALPRIVNVNPSMIFPNWNPDDIDDVWSYEMRWQNADGDPVRLIHSLDSDREGVWVTWSETLQRGVWRMTVEPEDWPYDWPMFLHGKNWPNANSFWGISDLEDADLNDAINSVASNLRRITRIYAHPIPWARGFGNSEIPIDGSRFAMATDPNANMGVLEMAQELKSSFDYLRFLRTAFAEITQIPENDPDRMTIGAQSGFALQVLYSDLMQKTMTKRNLYGMGVVEINRRLLEVGGYGENVRINLTWGDPLPMDQALTNASDAFELDRELISPETVAKRRGIDWEQEQERLTEHALNNQTLGALALTRFDQGLDTGFVPVGTRNDDERRSIPPGVAAATMGGIAAAT